MLRVIAGSARRIPLKTLEGMETRPTQDRIKETLFNILQADIPGCRFCDLFSGSGAIGIEALSRGAECCVFVEKNPRAVSCIRENLEKTRLSESAVVMNCDVVTALCRLKGKEKPFDFIFMDPPYEKELEKAALAEIKKNGLADENTVVIVEASLGTAPSGLEGLGFFVSRVKKYKTNQHIFLKMGEGSR